ncbi:MAG: hypothetical protein GY950_25560, partial [bacterium]|nr:hypothetical protein [bacterium]
DITEKTIKQIFGEMLIKLSQVTKSGVKKESIKASEPEKAWIDTRENAMEVRKVKKNVQI